VRFVVWVCLCLLFGCQSQHLLSVTISVDLCTSNSWQMSQSVHKINILSDSMRSSVHTFPDFTRGLLL
jgi:hypothetical protein